MSEGLRITDKEMRYISLFEVATGTSVVDCVDEEDMLVFVISSGDLRRAVAKGGKNIKEFSRIVKKRVKIIEQADDPSVFIRNALSPAKINELRLTEKPDGKRIAVVNVSPRDRGLAIGKEGRTIELVRQLVRRHHGIEQVIIQ